MLKPIQLKTANVPAQNTAAAAQATAKSSTGTNTYDPSAGLVDLFKTQNLLILVAVEAVLKVLPIH